MTIDEAIVHAREVSEEKSSIATELSLAGTDASECIKCMNEHEQLAEWMEELKFRRNLSLECQKEFFAGYEIGKKEQYNKAIDDYMNKLCNHCMQQTNECYKLECPFCTDGCDIVNIAEQLKGGGADA